MARGALMPMGRALAVCLYPYVRAVGQQARRGGVVKRRPAGACTRRRGLSAAVPGGRGGRKTYPGWLAAYAFMIVMLGTTLPTPLYPRYEQRWGFSALIISVIFAV